MLKFVKRGDAAHTNQEVCAVAIKAGQVLAHDVDKNSQLVPALANGALWRQAGVATHDALPGELVTVVIDGTLEFEAGTFDAGYVYVTSATEAGALVKHDHMGSAGYLSIVGYAVSDCLLEVVNLQRRVPVQRVEKVTPQVILLAPALIDPDLARRVLTDTPSGDTMNMGEIDEIMQTIKDNQDAGYNFHTTIDDKSAKG